MSEEIDPHFTDTVQLAYKTIQSSLLSVNFRQHISAATKKSKETYKCCCQHLEHGVAVVGIRLESCPKC